MHKEYVYSTNYPIYLTLLPSPAAGKASQFLLASIIFFFFKGDFCFFVLLVILVSILFFVCFFFLLRFDLIFVSLGYFVLFLLQFSFARRTSNFFRVFLASIHNIN